MSLVPPSRLKLALLNTKVRRELGIVTPYLLDEALGIVASDERLDGVTERVVGARAEVDDRVDEHGRDDDGLGACRRDGFSGHGPNPS